MAKVTIEVPESLLGDVYIAVGRVLRLAEDVRDDEPGQADAAGPDGDDDAAGEA